MERSIFVFVLVLVFAFVLAAAALVLVRRVFWGYPKAVLPSGSLLTFQEQAIVASVADSFFPRGGPISLSGSEAGLVGYFDLYLRRTPAEMRFLIHLLLFFFEHGTLLFGPYRSRFTRLNERERVLVLEAMSQSGIYFQRVTFLSLRTMLCMGYLAHPEVARQIGWIADQNPFQLNGLQKQEVLQ